MIKIERNFEALANWHKDNIKSDFEIIQLLDNKINNSGTPEDNFMIFLKANIDDVLSLNPIKLERKLLSKVNIILGANFFTKTITIPNKRGPKSRFNKDFIEELNGIFDYEKFCELGGKYNAYDLTEKLNIRVCPYCNRNLISTLKPIKHKTKTIKSGTRPTLDHFYLKSDFPYLALSFWNLIPSCYSCNTQFRNTKSFSIIKNIHPYINSYENTLYFQTDIDDITEFIGNSDKIFNIELKENKKTIKNTFKLLKANNNKEIFRLEELYNQNQKSEVREIINKAIIYDKGYSKSLFENWKDLFKDEYSAQQMMLGNYTKVEDFEKRPLSKLTRDIAEELGLI